MLIKLMYAPYNLLRWAQENYNVPQNAVLVCATPLRQATSIEEDQVVKFVIDQACNEEKQLTQAILGIASYLAQGNSQEIVRLVSNLLQEFTHHWLLLDAQSLVGESSSKILELRPQNIIHPITVALSVLSRMSIVGGEPLVYIGGENTAFGDFVFTGNTTQEQIKKMLTSIRYIFGDEIMGQFITETGKDWQDMRDKLREKYGFALSEYVF